MQTFFRNLLILSGGIALAISGLVYFTGLTLVHPFTWYILLFFIFVTAFTFYITRQGFLKDEDNFQLYYFGSMAFRIVMCLGVVVIYIIFMEDRHLQFALNFFALYFIYTGFEIYCILTNLRPNSKKQL